MARNRKYQSAAVLLGPALKAFVLCALIGGSGVGYVWQQSQIHFLARQKKDCENKLAELQHQNKLRHVQLDSLRLPWALEARIKEWNLGLVRPQPEQILRLTEPTRNSEPAGVETPWGGNLARLSTGQ